MGPGVGPLERSPGSGSFGKLTTRDVLASRPFTAGNRLAVG